MLLLFAMLYIGCEWKPVAKFWCTEWDIYFRSYECKLALKYRSKIFISKVTSASHLPSLEDHPVLIDEIFLANLDTK